MTPRRVTLTDGPPLYGAADYSALAISPHEKAIVAASRHLHDEHGFPLGLLAEGRNARTIFLSHLGAHGVLAMADNLSETPWSLVRVPHSLDPGEPGSGPAAR